MKEVQENLGKRNPGPGGHYHIVGCNNSLQESVYLILNKTKTKKMRESAPAYSNVLEMHSSQVLSDRKILNEDKSDIYFCETSSNEFINQIY